MPHVGHADSIANDKHGSRSDFSDRGSPSPVTPVVKVSTIKPPLFLYKSFIHPYVHSSHTPKPPGRLGHEPPGGSETKHRTCSEMHQNAPYCATKWRLASFDMSNQTELGEKTVDEHRAAFARSSKPGHLNLPVRS